MKLSLILSFLTIALRNQEIKSDGATFCKCLSRESLAVINSSNINEERSCQNAQHASIWMQSNEPYETYGFDIRKDDYDITCLAEGDMMFVIDSELEMASCIALICEACYNAGLPMAGCNEE